MFVRTWILPDFLSISSRVTVSNNDPTSFFISGGSCLCIIFCICVCTVINCIDNRTWLYILSCWNNRRIVGATVENGNTNHPTAAWFVGIWWARYAGVIHCEVEVWWTNCWNIWTRIFPNFLSILSGVSVSYNDPTSSFIVLALRASNRVVIISCILAVINVDGYWTRVFIDDGFNDISIVWGVTLIRHVVWMNPTSSVFLSITWSGNPYDVWRIIYNVRIEGNNNLSAAITFSGIFDNASNIFLYTRADNNWWLFLKLFGA